MKSTILAAAILFSLGCPLSVLAEAPAVAVNPLAVEVVPVVFEATAQPDSAATHSATEDPVTEMSEQQAVVETLSEAAATTTETAELPGVSEISAEAAAPAAARVEEPAAPEATAEEVAAGAMAADADMPSQPQPMHGMGMMRKGMGHYGKGPGGGKPGCDHGGRGRKNYQEQLVRRLDMIEARMAKMEAMLESLMQR